MINLKSRNYRDLSVNLPEGEDDLFPDDTDNLVLPRPTTTYLPQAIPFVLVRSISGYLVHIHVYIRSLPHLSPCIDITIDLSRLNRFPLLDRPQPRNTTSISFPLSSSPDERSDRRREI
jgi:hypothetical protein